MFKLNVVKDSLVNKGRAPFVAFSIEMVASDMVLWRLGGWRLINGYIAAPCFKGAAGFMPLMKVNEDMANAIYDAVEVKFKNSWSGTFPGVSLKNFEDAVAEIILPANVEKKKSSLR